MLEPLPWISSELVWWRRLQIWPKQCMLSMSPTTAYCARRYNQTLNYFASRGYRVSYYVPLIPVDRIAKIFKTTQNGNAAGSSNGDAAGVKKIQ